MSEHTRFCAYHRIRIGARHEFKNSIISPYKYPFYHEICLDYWSVKMNILFFVWPPMSYHTKIIIPRVSHSSIAMSTKLLCQSYSFFFKLKFLKLSTN
jgi:hypothetical protein